MNYITLTKTYYKNEDEYKKEYELRYHAPFARHLGIMIKQYNNRLAYPAFFNYTEEIAFLLEKIYKSYENFLYVIHSVPPVVLHQFSLLCILDEVKSTNDIEGVHSTRKELRDILDGTTPHSERMVSIVTKYSSLMNDEKIEFNTCEDIRKFYDDFAHEEIAKENPNHRLDGQIFRKEPTDIDSGFGKIIHRGLTPESEIIRTLNESLSILHNSDIPLLIRLSIFHYLFAYIHPFYDGNGRTDRFITSYFMSQHFHKIAALRLSVLIKKKRSEYYKLFSEADSEINRGDMTPFIIGFLQLILDTFEDTIGLLNRKQDQIKKYELKIRELNLNDEISENIYYILLQAALFYGQGISIANLIQITRKSRGTIKKRLDLMPKEHLIVTKNNKANYYKLNLMLFK